MNTRIPPPTRAERRCIFLAYRDVFIEKRARVRKKKVIRSLVLQHWSSTKSLVGGCGFDKVVHILRTLLIDGIFESEVQAGKEFPNLVFKSSQNDCWVERGEAPDTKIGALGKPNALLERPIKTECEGLNNDPEPQGRVTFSSMPSSILLNRRSHRLIRVGNPRTNSIKKGRTPFALQPPRFPYETQHRILSTIQQLLEQSCFNFVKQWLPSVLEKNRWSCAAAGELTEWLNIIKRHAGNLPNSCISIEGQASLNNIAPAVARLRHTAVHRLHLTSEEFLDQIRSARMLAEVLQDVRSTSTLQALYGRVDIQAKKMQHNISVMQEEVDTTLVQIQKQREELAQKEKRLLSYAAQQNIAIPVETGLALLDSIAPKKPNTVVVEKQGIGGRDKNAAHTYSMIVDDDDIESDEDRLQAELG
jgi:hypothetical protein